MASRALREPLFHFVVLGALAFALERLVVGSPASDGRCDRGLTRELVVERDRADELAVGWERVHGRPPTAEELESLVERWIDEEILFREGIELGIDRDDGVIRRRVADKMAFVLGSEAVIDPPTDVELAEFHAANQSDYASAERLDFSQVFFDLVSPDANDRVKAALQLLDGGASPAGLGDRFSGGRRYRKRSLDELESIFGPEFTVGLDQQAIGTWVQRSSRFGLHLVRVDRRSAARPGSLEQDRARIEQDWFDERHTAAAATAMADLRAQWTIERY